MFSAKDDVDDDVLTQFVMLYAKASLAGDEELRREYERKSEDGRHDSPLVPRERRSVTQVFRELGEGYFRRSFRMTYSSFRRLYRFLETELKTASGLKKYQAGPGYVDRSTNGPITLPVRLAGAIRFFAGGEAYDIGCMFGISHSSVFESIDIVIDAINSCVVMEIKFPSDHQEQQDIADGFRKKSPLAKVNCCAGAVDGLGIWTHKPKKEDCAAAGVDESKFYSGHKHKFGLNLQAICNHKKQFTYISIVYGLSSSDHMAFEVSELRHELERSGFLAPGLVIFGDNAYVNTHFMATPYPGTSQHTDRDSYNFYHSQLRITIECAFGWLTERWGMLRKKMPHEYSIQKIISVVSCLCRLHNFLIEIGDEEAPVELLEEDEWGMAVNGALPCAVRNGIRVPLQLMDAGHHEEEDLLRTRRIRTETRHRGAATNSEILPREALLEQIREMNLRRPS